MSYEEYYNKVKEELREFLSGFKLTEEELDAYMKREEDTIKEHYEKYSKEYENGEITLRVFENGCVDSTAWCLWLMYE